MTRRILAFGITLAFVAGLAPHAIAQSDTVKIDIIVQDAGTKAPVPLARVLLDGPVVTSEFAGDNGKVRFTDVPDGIYRARVFARGFQAVTSAQFESPERTRCHRHGSAGAVGLRAVANHRFGRLEIDRLDLDEQHFQHERAAQALRHVSRRTRKNCRA